MAFSWSNIPRDKVIMVLFIVGVFAFSGVLTHLFEHKPQAPVLQIGNIVLTLKGKGTLPPLHDVAQGDKALQAMVNALRAVPATQIFLRRDQVDADIVNILFRWAGADVVPDQAYGPFIDPHVVTFLKRIDIVPPTMQPGTQIGQAQAAALTRAWFAAFDHYRVRLLIQTGGREVYGGGATYDAVTDHILVPGAISRDFILRFQQDLQASRESGAAMRALLDFIDATKGFSRLSEQEQDLIMSVTPPAPAAQADAAVAAPAGAAPGQANNDPNLYRPLGSRGVEGAGGIQITPAPGQAEAVPQMQTPPGGAAR